jgi:esterase/lipase superfamily enzyme
MRSRVLWRLVAICALLPLFPLLSGCATRPESGYLATVADTPSGATDHVILVATTRQRDPRPGTLFNGERSPALDFAAVTVSVPPGHVDGNIELASQPPGDPNRDFVVHSATYLDGDAGFVSQLRAELMKRPAGSRNVLLFVHGYNTLFAEGVYRLAQVTHDARATGVPVLFSWASRGRLSQYVYDTNSATAARDALEHTIRLLFASNADHINILAHSMGNWATVESLRQIRIGGGLPHIEKLGLVVLAAPDIDIDVFKSQLRRFGKLRQPFYVILSKDDKALALSSFIAGGTSRLGADQNVAELAALGATVIDLTNLQTADPSNHDKFAQIAAIAPQLRSVLAHGIESEPGAGVGGQQTGLGQIVSAPLSILGTPITIVAGR